MKASELRTKTRQELDQDLVALRREQFNLRMQRATGESSRNDQHGHVRKNIARVKIVINELARQEASK